MDCDCAACANQCPDCQVRGIHCSIMAEKEED